MTAMAPIRIRIAQPIIEDEERRAVVEALDSGQLAQGPCVAAFEEAFARYAVWNGYSQLRGRCLRHRGLHASKIDEITCGSRVEIRSLNGDGSSNGR